MKDYILCKTYHEIEPEGAYGLITLTNSSKCLADYINEIVLPKEYRLKIIIIDTLLIMKKQGLLRFQVGIVNTLGELTYVIPYRNAPSPTHKFANKIFKGKLEILVKQSEVASLGFYELIDIIGRKKYDDYESKRQLNFPNSSILSPRNAEYLSQITAFTAQDHNDDYLDTLTYGIDLYTI